MQVQVLPPHQSVDSVGTAPPLAKSALAGVGSSRLALDAGDRISDGRMQMARRWKDEAAFQAVLKEIRAHNDRTAAIVAGATLEYALQLAIEARYSTISEKGRKKLFDSRGMLSSFYNKIEFATAVDVIDQQAGNYLHILRKIRIEFAHDMNPLSFTSEKILPLCEKLPVPNFLAGRAKLVEPKDRNERMRRRFIEKTHDLLLLLIGDLEWSAS